MDIHSKLPWSKRPSAAKKKSHTEKPRAHELFLEYEGYLPPSHSRSQKRPGVANSHLPSSNRKPHTNHTSKRSEVLSREHSKIASDRRQNPTGDASRVESRRTHSQRKRGVFALDTSLRREDSAHPPSKSSTLYALNRDGDEGRHSTSSWFLRCIGTAFKKQPSPPPSFTTIPPYYDSPLYQSDDFTALPALPGYEEKEGRVSRTVANDVEAPTKDKCSVDYEMIRNMRTLNVSGNDISGDRESGIGIEVQDRGEAVPVAEIPVVRLSKYKDYQH